MQAMDKNHHLLECLLALQNLSGVHRLHIPPSNVRMGVVHQHHIQEIISKVHLEGVILVDHKVAILAALQAVILVDHLVAILADLLGVGNKVHLKVAIPVDPHLAIGSKVNQDIQALKITHHSSHLMEEDINTRQAVAEDMVTKGIKITFRI